MGEHQEVALGDAVGDLVAPDLGLLLVGDQDHHDVAAAGGVGDVEDLEAGGLGVGAAGRVGAQPDDDVDPRLLQVQRVGVALRAVAEDRDRLAVEDREVRVGVVEDVLVLSARRHAAADANASTLAQLAAAELARGRARQLGDQLEALRHLVRARAAPSTSSAGCRGRARPRRSRRARRPPRSASRGRAGRSPRPRARRGGPRAPPRPRRARRSLPRSRSRRRGAPRPRGTRRGRCARRRRCGASRRGRAPRERPSGPGPGSRRPAMRTWVVSRGRPAEPRLRCASSGASVVTCELASVRP